MGPQPQLVSPIQPQPSSQTITRLCVLKNLLFIISKLRHCKVRGFSLEHPQGVVIVGIVGTVGTVGIVGIEFCRPEPRPTTPSVLVDISSYAYLIEQKIRYT